MQPTKPIKLVASDKFIPFQQLVYQYPILIRIFRYLPHKLALDKLQRICHAWYLLICKNNYLWKNWSLQLYNTTLVKQHVHANLALLVQPKLPTSCFWREYVLQRQHLLENRYDRVHSMQQLLHRYDIFPEKHLMKRVLEIAKSELLSVEDHFVDVWITTVRDETTQEMLQNLKKQVLVTKYEREQESSNTYSINVKAKIYTSNGSVIPLCFYYEETQDVLAKKHKRSGMVEKTAEMYYYIPRYWNKEYFPQNEKTFGEDNEKNYYSQSSDEEEDEEEEYPSSKHKVQELKIVIKRDEEDEIYTDSEEDDEEKKRIVHEDSDDDDSDDDSENGSNFDSDDERRLMSQKRKKTIMDYHGYINEAKSHLNQSNNKLGGRELEFLYRLLVILPQHHSEDYTALDRLPLEQSVEEDPNLTKDIFYHFLLARMANGEKAFVY